MIRNGGRTSRSREILQVTAVEPSPGMVTVLRVNLSERRIRNVVCVHKRWEAMDVTQDLDPPYDVVIAAFSLDMPAIWEAVQKMVRVCSGRSAFTGLQESPHGLPFTRRVGPFSPQTINPLPAHGDRGTSFVIPYSYVAAKISWRAQMGVARDIHLRSHE